MRKLLFTASIVMITSVSFAQHLISATEIASGNVTDVQLTLDWYGWNTTSMSLNGVTVYSITYNTIDVFGSPTVASGALLVPQYYCDTLPLVSYQHGTIFEKIWVPSNGYLIGNGLLFSGNGYITTMPDYLGLGVNPGTHPWCHWESEATASIDLIRAAREFLNGSLQIWDNNQLFLTGYSEGGHATMAVHKYIEVNNLQSEFNVVASAPMSGPYSMSTVQIDGVFDGDSTYYVPSLIAYCVDSYQHVYGNLYTNCNEIYDPPYDSIIPDWWASGIHWAGEWDALLPYNYYDFIQDSVLNNFLNNPNHPLNVDLRKNDLHNWIPQEPVRMLYCGMDSMAFPENAIMAQDTMLALGAPDVQAIDLDPIGTHETCWLLSYPYALTWFDSLRVECGGACGNNGNKVWVCHIPPGNNSNPTTICVSPNAVPALLAQGAYLGPCLKSSPLEEDDYSKEKFTVNVYPIPLKESIKVDITIIEQASTIVEAYDIIGRKLSSIDLGILEEGQYNYNWKVSTLGINKSNNQSLYFLKIVSGNNIQIIKLL